MSDNFGERAATEAEITAWIAKVKAGKAASRGYKVREHRRRDSMRPPYGNGPSHDSGA